MLLTGTCGGSPPDSSCTGHRLFTREFIWTVLSEHPKFTITGSMGKKNKTISLWPIRVLWFLSFQCLMHFQHRGKVQCSAVYINMIFLLFLWSFLLWHAVSPPLVVLYVSLSSDWKVEPSPLHSHITDDRTVCFYRCEGAGDKMPKHSHSRFKVSLYSSWTVLKWTGPVTSNQRLCHVRGTVPYQLFHITLCLLRVWINMNKTMSIFVQ